MVVGQCIPPASGFIIGKINNTRAVLFGGLENDGTEEETVSNNIYLLELSVSTVVCQVICNECMHIHTAYYKHTIAGLGSITV